MIPVDQCPGILTPWLGTSSCWGMALAADPCRDPEGWSCGVSPLQVLQSLRSPLMSWPPSGLLRGVHR